MSFSITFIQITASKIGHFYSFPRPSPPAISFLTLLCQWKGTKSVGFFSFFLKNFPWLCRMPPLKMPRDGESVEAPSRWTSQKTITPPLAVAVILYRCASLPGVWCAIVGIAQSPDETGFASFLLTVESGQHFWDCKPEGTQEFPPPRSAWRGRGHELMGRCGRPWTPNPKSVRAKGSRDPRATINPAPPTSLRELSHLRAVLNYGSASFLFPHLGPAFSTWLLLRAGEGEAKILSGNTGVLKAQPYPTRSYSLIVNLLPWRELKFNLIFSSAGGDKENKCGDTLGCRHRHCKVRGTNSWLLFRMLSLGLCTDGRAWRDSASPAGPLPCFCTCLTLSPLIWSTQGSTPKDILFFNVNVSKFPTFASPICQRHAEWQLYLHKKKKKARSKYNCQNMYIVVEKRSSIKSKKTKNQTKHPLPHPRNIWQWTH